MTILNILIVLFMLGALGSLVAGLVYMAKGGGLSNGKKQNKMMTYRIWFQAGAILLLLLFFYITKH